VTLTRRVPALTRPIRGWSKLCAFAALFAIGCSVGGQTGSEGAPVGDGGTPCARRATELSSEEVSPLGFTLSQLADATRGERSRDVLWGESADAVEFGPEHGPGVITLRVEPRGTGRFVHYELASDATTTTLGCPVDEVDLDADITLTTAGGALNETFSGQLQATTPASARLQIKIDFPMLAGSFRVVLPENSSKWLAIDATLGGEDFSGALYSQIEETGADTSSARIFTYACWPAVDGVCASGRAPGQ
jgi:hypothetical protein